MTKRNYTRYRYASLNGKLYRSMRQIKPDAPVEVSEDNGQTWAVVPPPEPQKEPFKFEIGPTPWTQPMGELVWSNVEDPTTWTKCKDETS